MARTQLDGDAIKDKTVTESDLADSVNPYALNQPKIYKIAGYRRNFKNINYKILGLFPKYFINRGEVYRVEYFKEYDGSKFSDLILVVDITYERAPSGFALSRTVRRRWVNNDEGFNSDEKITIKNYRVNHFKMISEGKKRRGLLVDNMQIPVMTAMTHALVPDGSSEEDILMLGRKFLDDYEDEFKKFIDNSSTVTDSVDPNYGKKRIVVRLENEASTDHLTWLDKAPAIFGGASIRQFLINEFSI